MKHPLDTPHPDPVVTHQPEELEALNELEPADGEQEPHLSAAEQQGLIDDTR
ncbi:MAG: hypothetical protein GAK45_01458 [Pseudomonas citronellolis]|nr:MAG: hypothetical protein GAK45_01458 [Pseudomonas citronellolis]